MERNHNLLMISTINMSQPPAKRRRTEITVKIKKEICQYKKDHPRSTQLQISTYAEKTFNLSLARSTISDILKQSDKWLAASKDTFTSVRHYQGSQTKLEAALYVWFCEVRSKSAIISDDLLIEKAKQLAQNPTLQVSNSFQYSRGWLAGFKSRHNIKKFTMHGEAASELLFLALLGGHFIMFFTAT